MSETEQPTIPEGEVVEPGTGGGELVERAQEQLARPDAEKRPDYRLAMEMGKAMAASGYFADARKEAEAAVKMIIGLDLGISPTAAMTAIHIVKGKPMVGYQVLAAKIIADPHYGYRVVAHDDDHCKVEFTRDDDLIGDVEWSIERAKEIGLVKPDSGWANYPRNMLIARCLSDGVKWYMPDLLTGAAVYVDEEIPDDRRTLAPPGAERAPALTDAKAEGLRTEAREAYDQLRELNPVLLPPGQYNKLVRDADHSHERLAGVVAQIVDVRDVEAQINEALEGLKAISEEAAKDATRKIERVMNRREALGLVRDALDAAESPDG